MSSNTQEKSRPSKVTLIPTKGVSQTINYLLEDRDELEWLVAIGRNKQGEIFFYDTGGDIVEDLGSLEYMYLYNNSLSGASFMIIFRLNF